MSKRPNQFRRGVLGAIFALGVLGAPAWCQVQAAEDRGATARASEEPMAGQLPPQAQGLEVQEHLGAVLPMELVFTNAEGRPVRLGDYFPAASGGVKAGELPKPAIVVIGYYGCPVVCSVVKQKIVESLDRVDLTAGKDFNLLVFSFEEAENAAVARGAKEHALQGYTRAGTPEIDSGFAFHAGEVEATRQLANAVGFPYRRLENGQFSHPVALFVISPEGVVCRYIYGFEYPPAQVKLALMDASKGTLAKSLGDYFNYYCYLYDPAVGKYTIQSMRVMKIGGAVMVVCVAALIGGLRLSEYLKNRARRGARAGTDPNLLARGAGQGPASRDQSVTRPVA